MSFRFFLCRSTSKRPTLGDGVRSSCTQTVPDSTSNGAPAAAQAKEIKKKKRKQPAQAVHEAGLTYPDLPGIKIGLITRSPPIPRGK